MISSLEHFPFIVFRLLLIGSFLHGMPSISKKKKVGRLTVTNPRAVKYFLDYKYFKMYITNILVIAGTCKILKR